MSYITLYSQEKHIFYSIHTFTRIRQHYFSNYWGDQCMGPPPPQTLGDRPPVHLGLPLIIAKIQRSNSKNVNNHIFCLFLSRLKSVHQNRRTTKKSPYTLYVCIH